MNRLSKIIKKMTGVTLAATMVLSSVSVMAAPAVDTQDASVYNNHTVVPGDAHTGSVTGTRLTWGAIEDIVNVSEPSGQSVGYFDNGIIRTRNDCKEYADTMSDGWYVLNGDKATGNAVTIKGKVNLILADNSCLHANNGIYITKDSELIIWAQSNNKEGNTGKIVAHPENGPGIGAVRDVVGGNLTINGGIIDAQGGKYAAGIGGGRGEKSGFGNITINNGFVYATGGEYGAGIGRGQRNWSFGVITIGGGEVNATGGRFGAGIGGGEDRGTPPVIINGGTVDAKTGGSAAGIGGGYYGNQDGKVTINGGTVNAVGAPVGIGGGCIDLFAVFNKPKLNGAEVEINGGNVTTTGIGSGEEGTNGPITINGGTVNSTVTKGAAIGAEGDQKSPITINGGVVNAKMDGTGSSIFSDGVGIGSGGEDAGEININGGTVTAVATGGAGIGGAEHKGGVATAGGRGGNVTIKGGTVTAIALGKSAGIGGGESAAGGTVTITGGTVIASGGSADNTLVLMGSYGAGPASDGAFASGASSTATQMLITGIVMAATSGDVGGAGIGGGYKGDGANVKITGGTVIASAKHKGTAAIGAGQNGSKGGSLEIYDEAEVKAGNDAKALASVKADERVAACRNNTNAVISKCSHTDCQYKDKNAKVHEVVCSHCKSSGKAMEQEHHFDKDTHKCACGRTQYKLTAHVVNETINKDVYKNAKYNKSDGFAYSYDGGITYVTEGDTLTVSLENKNSIQEVELIYSENGKNEVVKPLEYKTNSDGTILAKYTMPNRDVDITYTVKDKPVELVRPEYVYAPQSVKGLVYNGKPQSLTTAGMAKNGKIYFAIGSDDKNAPEFDGVDGDVFGSDSGNTWKIGIPGVTDAGTYYVWYMIKGDPGYGNSEPACLTCEIKSIESAGKDIATKEGVVNDISGKTGSSNTEENAKKQYKASVEVHVNHYNEDVKFDMEVNGNKLEQQKSGDILNLNQGDKIKIDIPSEVNADKTISLFYKKSDNVAYTAAPIIKKVNDDGSLHVEYEMPGYDARLSIYIDGSKKQMKDITYNAPKANTGLIYNGRAQALVKAGSATGGKMYYALGESNTKAPEFDGLSDGNDKTWGIGVPKATEPGRYYVWYVVKGNEGYEDVSPSCIEVEIGKSIQQKREAVEKDEDDNKNHINPTAATKLSDAVEVKSEDEKQGVNLWLEEEDITDSMDEYSKMVLYNRFSDYEIPVIYNLSLYMKVGDEQPVDIVDLDEAVELSVDIPNRYVKEGRDYILIRLNSDDPKDVTIVNPTAFDKNKNELIFETNKICPFAIAYRTERNSIEEATVAVKSPSLISPRAKEGLYYSGKDMELITEGMANGGTIYYAIGDSEGNEPEFDGLSDNTDKKWSTDIPKAKDVGSYNVWYKVKGDKGYSDSDSSYVVSVIKEVPTTKADTVVTEQGKPTDVTEHPDMEDKNPQKAKIDGDNAVKSKSNAEPSQQPSDDEEDIYDVDDDTIYWIEAHDITDTLTEEDITNIYNSYRNYYIGKLFDLTLTMQVGEELYDVTELEENIEVSFEVPEDIVSPGRKYIIYMIEDDGEFFDTTVIRPTSYDENTRRLTFETDKIKPFILGYTDDPEEKDIIEFNVEDEIQRPLTNRPIVVSDNTPSDNVTVTPPAVPTQTVSMSDNKASTVSYQNTDGTTIKLTSAKTGDENIIDIIIKMINGLLINSIINLGSSLR